MALFDFGREIRHTIQTGTSAALLLQPYNLKQSCPIVFVFIFSCFYLTGMHVTHNQFLHDESNLNVP